MKASTRLLTVSLFLLFAITGEAQKKANKYTDYDRGYANYYNNKFDSAFLFLNRYVSNPDDSLKKGRSYRFIAEMQKETGDLYGAQESLTNAMKTLDSAVKEQREELWYVYNLLGNISLDLGRYEEAINIYDKALLFYKGLDQLAESMNGKATTYQRIGNYPMAIAIYDSALALKPAYQPLVARIIDNSARTKLLQDPKYPAINAYRAALKIRTDLQDSLALNASYAHISDYYSLINPDSALWYANKMYETATTIESPDDKLEAIDKLIRLNKSPDIKEQWYEYHKRLNDSLQQSRDTTRSRYALIRYDFQKSKTDYLLLQQSHVRQRILLYSIIGFTILMFISLRSWYVKRRNRIREESEKAIRESKLRTSQKVHDVVANQLYWIMNELEHNTVIDRDPLLDKIEDLYEKSRDISYEDAPASSGRDFNQEVHALLMAFNDTQTKVFIVENSQQFWNRFTESQKEELILVLNELMVNMKKHSRAKNVTVRFERQQDKAFITYSDDGVGFEPDMHLGNGLNNTVSRINKINGEINFGKSGKQGASITIRLPL